MISRAVVSGKILIQHLWQLIFFIKMLPKIHKNMKVISKQIPDSETKRCITLINIHFTSTTTTGGFKGRQGGHAPPQRCQRWRRLSRAHLNNPSTAKSRQLLGDFVPQTPYRASTSGPRWWPPELAPSKFIFWIRPCFKYELTSRFNKTP